ncbi:ArnT family glycosyltransferase [Streptomyces sp. NPDC021098]|uniref:ArnT family glycosyltransferase n=1 Tax=unclassified Streptomyces TaxID=2593676 RepID=UPI00379C9223
MTAPALAVRAPDARSVVGRARTVPWLTVVAVVYAVAQLALVVPHVGKGLLWDESVYVSQLDPRHPTVFFSAPRSRGVSVLVAPVVALTSSVPVLRVALVLMSAAALYGAFRVWRKLVGERTAALAALLFSGLWITELSGSQAMPNLWVALCAVAAVGWFLRAPAEPRAHWWLVALLAGATLLRAPDGGWLALPLLVSAVAVRGWRPQLPALLAGVALGAAQWVIEAYARFGGIGARLRLSSATEGGMAPHANFGASLRSLDGPLLCRPCHVPLRHPELTVWWLALPLLAAAALALALHDHRRGRGGPHRLTATVLPVACAAALATPYLLLISYSAPRFLMPAYALLALPVAGLATRALHGARQPVAVAAVLAAVLALHLGGQYAVLVHNTAGEARTVEQYQTAAAGLHRLGMRPPCLVTGPRALPVGYAAGCASEQVKGNNRSTTVDGVLDRAVHVPTAALGRPGGHRPHYAHGWTPRPLPGTGWVAYLAPHR